MHSLPSSIRIGTRGSELALWQANRIAGRIEALGVHAEIVIIKTRGDIDQKTPVSQIGSKAIFIKELEDALLAREVDLAVHSLKDLPVELPEGLELAAVPERETPLDAWVCPDGFTFEEAPQGTIIASGSLRRSAQLLARRPDFKIMPIRGNVPTRIDKLRQGEAHVTLLAVAGLRRLGLDSHITQVLPPELMTPAMSQGALGLETRRGELRELMGSLDNPLEHTAARAERSFMRTLGGGCRTPVGILARPREGGGWKLVAMLASADGRHLLRREIKIAAGVEPGDPAEALAREMLAEAPREIVETLEQTS